MEERLAHFSHKKGHITNIYLIDSEVKAIVDFVKYHEELYRRPTNTLKTKAGRIAGGTSSPAAITCL